MAGVRAYHVIFTAYGFWLPNDPRGSWSSWVRKWELFRFGPATKVTTRRSVAAVPHDRAAREAAKAALDYPPVEFDGYQGQSIARGFAEMVRKSNYVVHACSILPRHVHMVLARHEYRVESMVRLLKGAASHRLSEDGRHPLAPWPLEDGTIPSPWARKCWKVFLNTDEDILRAIPYVDDNPLKEGKPRQRWSFVTPFTPADV